MAILFYILFFFIPLILWPYTSEVFEFNKIIFLYIITTFITVTWIVNCIKHKQFIFRRTILDIPLLIFLSSQTISTFLSIDPRTSFLGYYSRFNGGLLSTICYSLLYWAFVSNMTVKQSLYAIRYTLYAFVLVCIYGVLQHFGIDKDIWVQDVQNRVFSTLGQPNWLAATLVALLPLSWSLILNAKKLNAKFFLYSYTILLYITLLFTKSRSGLLGFAIADLIFWSFVFYKERLNNLKYFLILNSIFLVLFLVFNSSFIIHHSSFTSSAPALETGGTESGTIRKIVWKGAIDIWRHYPVFGSGLETFAYIYPTFRPIEHNLVSEWDFIYNKAHNEFLNILATSGIVGLLSYLELIIVSILVITNYQIPITKQIKNYENKNLLKIKNYELKIALLAGYISILITNFFGFSVVVTQLYLFLFPAISIVLSTEYEVQSDKTKVNKAQWILIILVCIPTYYILQTTYYYFVADINYNYAKQYNTTDPQKAIGYLEKSIKYFPREPLYHIELAKSYVLINNADKTINEAEIAINLSPSNINLKKVLYTIFVRLVKIDPNYLLSAQKILEESIQQAPTDAKLYYNLGVTLWRMGKLSEASKILTKCVELKPNYKEGRFAFALLLEDLKKPAEAKNQLEYILKSIDPKDELTKEELLKLK